MKKTQPVLRIDDEEGQVLHVTWGSAGSRAIVSIAGPTWGEMRQCTLTPEAATELSRFLDEGPDQL